MSIKRTSSAHLSIHPIKLCFTRQSSNTQQHLIVSLFQCTETVLALLLQRSLKRNTYLETENKFFATPICKCVQGLTVDAKMLCPWELCSFVPTFIWNQASLHLDCMYVNMDVTVMETAWFFVRETTDLRMRLSFIVPNLLLLLHFFSQTTFWETPYATLCVLLHLICRVADVLFSLCTVDVSPNQIIIYNPSHIFLLLVLKVWNCCKVSGKLA